MEWAGIRFSVSRISSSSSFNLASNCSISSFIDSVSGTYREGKQCNSSFMRRISSRSAILFSVV